MGICKGEFNIQGSGECMKRFLVMTAIFVVGIASFGCSSSSEPDKTASTTNSRSESSSPNTAPSNTVVGPGNFRDRVEKRNRVDANPAVSPDPPIFRPAPDNSESAVTMNKDGSILEIRVFKSHSQLAKVESTWFDPAEKSLKVHLKSGRVVDVQTEKLTNLNSASIEEILEVAGLKTSKITGDRPRIAIPK